jgi:acid phosphatase (class A)
MRGLLLLAGAAILAAAAPAQPSLLAPGDLDPALVLPPPPTPGSAQADAELRELRALEAIRSPAMLADALRDSETKDATIFAEAIGPAFRLDRLPATTKLMGEVRAAEKDAADRAKAHFRRSRPWVGAAELKHCGKGDDADWSSYPSGHTTMGYSMGAVLARLVPEKATAIMARAARYGESRVICQVHFRSDVTGGEALGLLVAERLMTKPAFQADFVAARAELATAGLTKREIP